jgi:hypothetical protein
MGQPDNDFLVYLPVRDMWQKNTGKLLMQFSIHAMGKLAPEFIKSILAIDKAGYDCDYISERLLMNTKYERKCPDLLIDDKFYEYEGFEKPWKKEKVRRMVSHGMKQSARMIINNTKGASDRFIRQAIVARINVGATIMEVWLYEKGRKRLLFKDGHFY